MLVCCLSSTKIIITKKSLHSFSACAYSTSFCHVPTVNVLEDLFYCLLEMELNSCTLSLSKKLPKIQKSTKKQYKESSSFKSPESLVRQFTCDVLQKMDLSISPVFLIYAQFHATYSPVKKFQSMNIDEKNIFFAHNEFVDSFFVTNR